MSRVQLRGGRGSKSFDVVLPGGTHAIVGAPEPWGAELVDALAGLARPRWVEARIDGLAPYREPEVRRRIGSLRATEDPVEASTVGAAMFPPFVLRGESVSPTDALAAFCLEGWVGRRTASLSPLERRSVALAAALALSAPVLLVLHEPLAAGLERARVLTSLLRHAAAGATVVIVVSSEGDAVELGAERWGLSDGSLFPAEGLSSREAARFRVESDDARALSRALSSEEDVSHVGWDAAGGGGHVEVEGQDASRVALAILRSAQRESLGIRSIVRAPQHRLGSRGAR